jgi:hypothetical protein
MAGRGGDRKITIPTSSNISSHLQFSPSPRECTLISWYLVTRVKGENVNNKRIPLQMITYLMMSLCDEIEELDEPCQRSST